VENEKIFVPGNLRSPVEFFPVPVYFENTKWRLASNGVWIGSQLVGLLVILVCGALISTVGFARAPNVLSQVLIVCLPAMAMIMVLANGSLDLSMGSVCGLVGAIAAKMMIDGVPPEVAVPVVILIALAIGFVNSVLIGVARLPGILVTLVVGIAGRSLVIAVTEGNPLMSLPDLSGLPVLGFLVLILLAGAAFVWVQLPAFNARLSRGRKPSGWLRVGLPYVFTSLAAGVTGLVLMSWVRGVNIQMGQNVEFDSVVIIILAGACLYSRYGNVVAVIPGALALVLIKTFAAMANWSYFTTNVIVAVLGLFGLGWLYFYHWIVGLLFRNASRKNAGAGAPGA
jgi:ribose/xylose/arabinose/galactoside ABC-type transport system permease subunit